MMIFHLSYQCHDGPDCEVFCEGHSWCFRQEDWPRTAPDIEILQPAVPLLCEWLRRVVHFEEYWLRNLYVLPSDAPLSALIPGLMDRFGNQPPVRLSLEADPAGVWWAFVAITAQGRHLAARFDPSEIPRLLSVLEGHIYWEKLSDLATQFKDLRLRAEEHARPKPPEEGKK